METREILLELGIVFLCLFFCAFFAATETALTSLSSIKARHMAENGGRRARVLKLWIKNPHGVIAGALIGNELTTILSSLFADRLIEGVFGHASVVVVTLVMTFFIVLFSEALPKSLAKTWANDIVVPFLTIFRFFYYIFLPMTWVMSGFTYLVNASLMRRKKAGPQITEEELQYLINVSEEEGVLGEQKHEMLTGVFELGETIVREIMVHRTDMSVLAAHQKIVETVEIFRQTGLSRIPVFEDRIDNITGILHVKDVLFFLKKHRDDHDYWETTANDLKREALFVPESKPVDSLFQDLRKQRQHMAIVLDEYGGITGLVTMEDVFEEIVGEVRDEFDNEEDAIRPTQFPNQYLVECKIHIDDFCDFFELNIEDMGVESLQLDTLGGLILHHFGQVPKKGDRLTIKRVSLEVIEVSRRRVRRVLAKVNEEAESPSGNGAQEEGAGVLSGSGTDDALGGIGLTNSSRANCGGGPVT